MCCYFESVIRDSQITLNMRNIRHMLRSNADCYACEICSTNSEYSYILAHSGGSNLYC
jgi:hypothetical protein